MSKCKTVTVRRKGKKKGKGMKAFALLLGAQELQLIAALLTRTRGVPHTEEMVLDIAKCMDKVGVDWREFVGECSGHVSFLGTGDN